MVLPALHASGSVVMGSRIPIDNLPVLYQSLSFPGTCHACCVTEKWASITAHVRGGKSDTRSVRFLILMDMIICEWKLTLGRCIGTTHKLDLMRP